jgi:hypothetical protein
MAEKSFRKFLEEEEKRSPYLSSLEDELGLDPSDMEKEPQIASFFSMGGITNNVGSYKILKFNRNEKGDVTHAVVKKINDPAIKKRTYKDKEGEAVRLDDEQDEETFIVPVEDLDKLLSQDFQPQQGGMA